jgi:hypothetical protein
MKIGQETYIGKRSYVQAAGSSPFVGHIPRAYPIDQQPFSSFGVRAEAVD